MTVWRFSTRVRVSDGRVTTYGFAPVDLVPAVHRLVGSRQPAQEAEMVLTAEPAAEFFLVEAGRRHTIHRGIHVDGADHIATERCNLDSSAKRHRVSGSVLEGDIRWCRWCFPNGEADARKVLT